MLRSRIACRNRSCLSLAASFVPTRRSVPARSPTFQRLLAWVRPTPCAGQSGGEVRLPAEQDQWEDLLALAVHHRVYGPLCRGVAALPSGRVPADVQSDLASAAHAARLRNKFLVGEMGRVQSLLAEAGVRSLAFKGPVLAYTVYGDGGYRRTGDIDLMVHPDDFPRAERRLVQDEYQPFREESSFLDRLGTHLNQQTVLVRGKSFAIDLHASLTPIVHASGARFDALWDRSVRRDVEGTCLRVLHPTDRLLMLCQQGIKNRWNRLKYTADLAECLWGSEDPDWTGLWAEARRTSQARLLLTNLHVAHDLFGLPLPEFLHAEIAQDRPAERIGTWAVDKLQSGTASVGVKMPERMWVYWTIQDTVSHSLHYAAYSLVRNLWEQARSVRSAVRGLTA